MNSGKWLLSSAQTESALISELGDDLGYVPVTPLDDELSPNVLVDVVYDNVFFDEPGGTPRDSGDRLVDILENVVMNHSVAVNHELDAREEYNSVDVKTSRIQK